MEKAIEEAQTTQEATPVLSNASQPNRGPKGGAEAEQVKKVDVPSDEAGWKTVSGHRRHGSKIEETGAKGAPGIEQNQSPALKAQAAVPAEAPSKTFSGKPSADNAKSANKGAPAAVPQTRNVPHGVNRKAPAKIEPVDDWPSETAQENSRFWLDSNEHWGEERALEEEGPEESEHEVSQVQKFPVRRQNKSVSAHEEEDEELEVEDALSVHEDQNPAEVTEEASTKGEVGREVAESKNKTVAADVDLDTPREAFSERRAVEIESLFASLITNCLDSLDETIASMTKKKIELLEEKARIEATIAALEKRLDEFKTGANEIVGAVDPYEEDIEALKENL